MLLNAGYLEWRFWALSSYLRRTYCEYFSALQAWIGYPICLVVGVVCLLIGAISNPYLGSFVSSSHWVVAISIDISTRFR